MHSSSPIWTRYDGNKLAYVSMYNVTPSITGQLSPYIHEYKTQNNVTLENSKPSIN